MPSTKPGKRTFIFGSVVEGSLREPGKKMKEDAMKTKFENKRKNLIMEWIGEASLGCLENSYMSAYLQHQIPGLMQRCPSPPVRRVPHRRDYARH
jgi:hypothetical protein